MAIPKRAGAGSQADGEKDTACVWGKHIFISTIIGLEPLGGNPTLASKKSMTKYSVTQRL